MGKDTRTRYQGCFARHRKGCAVERLGPGADLRQINRACSCRPAFFGVIWDRTVSKTVKTAHVRSAMAARDARSDLAKAIDRGERPERSYVRLGDAVDRFVLAAGEGVALNKHGHRYKPRAVEDLKGALEGHVLAHLGKQRRLSDVRRRDVQAMVDGLVEQGLSGSRVRSVVNAVRSLYRWAQLRDLAGHDPAQHVLLPAMGATPRERVATPLEVRRLVDALPLEDAIPYALAGYANGRRAEILALRWQDLDLDAALAEWGADELARKYGASHRVVPLLRPLVTLLRREYLRQGRPKPDALVCPPRRHAKSGRLAAGPLQVRAVEKWSAAKLNPIGLHELRHTSASWMDAAGVPPKAQSVLMGHAVPDRQPGAADITLARYVHTLPGYVEDARERLEVFVEEREKQEAAER